MTKWIILVAGGLLLASCNTTSKEEKSPKEKLVTPIAKSVSDNKISDIKPAPKAANSRKDTPTSKTPKNTMNDHELLPYFQVTENDSYTNCHSEKGPTDDFENGKEIPKALVKKYRLYRFNISPSVGLKFKQESPKVKVVGQLALSHNENTILIYHVGVAMEGDEIQPNWGVDTRALIISSKSDKTRNYFIGGYAEQENKPDQTVCRKVTFNGEDMVLTLDTENGGSPRHLKLKQVSTRDLF